MALMHLFLHRKIQEKLKKITNDLENILGVEIKSNAKKIKKETCSFA
jgi:hypothetical protein